MAKVTPGAVAIFPWGDVIEDFLQPLGLEAQDFANRIEGGWLFGYVAGLQACGWRPVIVYASKKVRRPERLVHVGTGAPIWLVPGRSRDGGRTSSRPSLRAAAQWCETPMASFARVLRAENCRTLIVQDYEHARFDALALFARLLRLPLYATFQGGDVTLSPLEGRVRGGSLGACRGVIVASERERRRLQARYGLSGERVVDIPNPVDAQLWRAEPRAEARASLGIAPDAFVVVSHGRIDIHRKGLDVLLEAWRAFADDRADARLVLVGAGQDQARFSELLSGRPGVTWISEYVTDPALIRRWLSAADVYAALSRVEGMPVAPLEAMACGLPVVASDAHGLADIFGDGEASGGLVTPRGEAAPAAAAFRRLAEDAALRARLGQAARKRVEDRYGLAAVGERLHQLLSEGPPCR